MLLFSLFACTATLTLNGPPNANVYIVKGRPLSKNEEPSMSECNDQGSTMCEVTYFAWDKYYWGIYDNGWSKVGYFRNEVKVAPAVAGLFIWPALIWAWGPEENPVEVQK